MPPSTRIMPQDAGDVAVIENETFSPSRTSSRGDVRLQVGESQHQVRLAARECDRPSRW